MNQPSLVEVEQVSCYATSLHAMFSMMWSLCSRSVVQVNAWTQLCEAHLHHSVYILCDNILHMACIYINLWHSNSLVLPPCKIHFLTCFKRALLALHLQKVADIDLLYQDGTLFIKRIRYYRDVSFLAFASIPAFKKSKFPHFYLFSAHFRGFSPDSHTFSGFSGLFLQASLHHWYYHTLLPLSRT